MKSNINQGDVLIAIRELMKRYNCGLWNIDRWQADAKFGFPRPVILRRKRYYRLREIEAFEARFVGGCPCYKAA